MSDGVALGAALHFDFELAADPRPFAKIVESLFGATSPEGVFRHFYTSVDNRLTLPPAPLDLRKLLRRIADGKISTAAAETAPKTPEVDEMCVSADTAPLASRSRSMTTCRYDLTASFGAARLAAVRTQRALDAVVAFADAVAARAGVVHWARSTVHASCLASCSGSARLSREQSGHITDLMYWQPRWGDVIRGPAWGTFLGATHVATLGGVARIERDSGCARVVALGSGGAFLQATPLDAPIVEGDDDGGALARLAAFLAPVMGRRT